MADSEGGGVRFDFDEAFNIVRGEHRVFDFLVEDLAGDPVEDVSDFVPQFYITSGRYDPASDAAITKDADDIETVEVVEDGTTYQALRVTIDASDWGAVKRQTYWYRVWNKQNDGEANGAWGRFVVVA